MAARPIYLSIYLSVYLSTFLLCLPASLCNPSACLPIYLSICLPVCLASYVPICPNVYLYIYPTCDRLRFLSAENLELSTVLPFKPKVGQNIALQISPSARNSAFLSIYAISVFRCPLDISSEVYNEFSYQISTRGLVSLMWKVMNFGTKNVIDIW